MNLVLSWLVMLAVIGTFPVAAQAQPQAGNTVASQASVENGAPDLAAILAEPNNAKKMAGLVQATRYYERLLQQYPNEIDKLQQLGLLYSWTGKTEQAIITYQSAIKLDSTAAFLKTDLARVYRWTRRFGEAEQLYKEVLKTHPDDHQALKGLMITHMGMGDYPNAEQILTKALALYPDDAELYKEAGLLYAWQQRYGDATAALRKAIDLSPDIEGVYLTLGDVYYWDHDYQKALDAYKKALTLDPNSQEAHLMMAKVFLVMGNTGMSENHAHMALRIDPVSPAAIELLQEIAQQNRTLSFDHGVHYLELFALLFVATLILIVYRKHRRVLRLRYRVLAKLIRFIIPAIIVFAFAVFFAEHQLNQWLDIEIYESFASASLLILLGLVCIAQMRSFRSSKSRDENDVVLAIGAHPDDIELGCGGYILKAKANGAKVYGLTLSKGERGTDDVRMREREASHSALYLGLDDYSLLDFPDSFLQERPTELREAIAAAIKKFAPTIVLTHTRYDSHGDHRAVYTATREAARGIPTVMCYETVSTPEEFSANYYVDITDSLGDMLKAIQLHKSQGDKIYMDPELIKGRAAHRGIQSGVPYASAFEVVRIVD